MAVTAKTAIGIRQAALRYGLAMESIKKYRAWGYLPDPEFVVSTIPVWDVRKLDKWAEARGYLIDPERIG